MPILIDDITFTDSLGKSTSFYESNAGDEITAVMTVRGSIRMSSVGNPLTLDPTTNQVQSTQSWLDAGFRPNQWVYCVRYTSGGAVLAVPNNPFWSFVSYVDDTTIDLGACPTWYSLQNSEIMTLTAVVGPNDTNALPFDQLDILLNHSQNGVPFTPFSQIDGEVTRARMTGIGALSVGGSINGILQGYQSGQFLLESSITRVVNVDQFYRWEIMVKFINSGMYDSGWFFSSDCLKAGISTEWAVVIGEPYNRLTGTYSLDADTGYYDEPFNTGLLDATLVQGIGEIDYCVPTTGDIIVDGPITDIGIGSCYLPIDTTYYKNRLESQSVLTMIVPTSPALAATTYNSFINPDGGAYDLTINSVTSVGTVTTINVTITPNAAFQTFIDGRDPQDRRFLLWVRCGNLNLLAHDSQLVCDPPEGGPLLMEQSYAFLDHSENVSDITTDFSGFECNTEDDIAYVGRFLLDKNQPVESFSIKMEAYNVATGDDFTLQQVTFGFSTVQISGDGRYLLNESQTIINTLPNTSEKLTAVLDLDGSLDTPTQYGVRIYAPWLMNWKYWLDLLSASVDFYPAQNQNWVQYDDLLPDWTVRLELSLVIDGLSYTHTEPINIKDYDSDPNVVQNIELYIDSSNINVGIVTEGQLMRVVATHQLINGQFWDPSNTWGMITVEPFEAERRWILSTVVPYDNNTNNPLYPLSGLLMQITYPTPDVARMECYFNPDLIDLSEGVKFTTKIKSKCPTDEVIFKTMTDGTIKTTTGGDNKTIAN
jgi:hypothetical protein